jgi:hypothetical protein
MVGILALERYATAIGRNVMTAPLTDDDDGPCFTLVFRGNIRDFTNNPLTTVTIYGIPYAVAGFDALERLDAALDGRDVT